MKVTKPPIPCYIASAINSEIDPFLEQRGFGHGLVMFAVPDFGLMFRCRAEGDPIDLEFGAFFSLLKFLKTYLVTGVARHLEVRSSNPEFVFSFAPHSRHLARGTARELILREYDNDFRITVKHVTPNDNRCLISPIQYPSLPAGNNAILKPNTKTEKRSEFKPFQRGIQL